MRISEIGQDVLEGLSLPFRFPFLLATFLSTGLLGGSCEVSSGEQGEGLSAGVLFEGIHSGCERLSSKQLDEGNGARETRGSKSSGLIFSDSLLEFKGAKGCSLTVSGFLNALEAVGRIFRGRS